MKNLKNEYVSWMFIIGAMILILEVLFFNRGLIISLFVAAGLIYLGHKKGTKKKGKLLFWCGIIFFCASIFNMITFKFFLLAILLHFFIQFTLSKKNPKRISPTLVEPKASDPEDSIIIGKPLLNNVLFGQQKTPNGVYEWNDINIQAGIGDTVIDLSYTVFPKGETVIFIRNMIGNIHILVPYEVEVSVHHSVMAGSTTVFDFQQSKVFNQVFHLKTPGYDKADQKVKIFTSLLVGNIEVGRI